MAREHRAVSIFSRAQRNIRGGSVTDTNQTAPAEPCPQGAGTWGDGNRKPKAPLTMVGEGMLGAREGLSGEEEGDPARQGPAELGPTAQR